MNKTQSYHFIANLTANFWRARRTGAGVFSPSSGVHPGAKGVVYLSLPTSFVVGALCLLLGSLLLSHSAYATFSASISRSGTVSLAEPGSSTIRPTSAGTLGTGSDTVSVTTNCTYGGYKLYVSATSTGGTALKLSDNSDSIPTSSNLVGSETTLSRDTWGVGKTASAFSGLQAYTDDIGKLTPFYTGVTSDSYTFYYGVNVSTAKTPGTYTGEVLYTVLMNEACTKYTLSFDGNGATTNNLTSQDLNFDSTIDLATISSSDKIARTGYTLTGWQDQSSNSYDITGTADVNPNDLASVTLTAQWQINSHTVTVNKGSNVTTVTGAGSYDYNSPVTISATAFSTGYHFSGWTVNSGGVTLYSDEALTNASATSTPAYFTMPDNDVAITANAAANTLTVTYSANGGTGSASKTSETASYGINVTMPTRNTLAKSGYTFQGWSLSSSATSATWSAGASVNPTSINSSLSSSTGVSKTVYAVWKSSVSDCSSTVHPTTSTGCKMKDGNTWILGNRGNTVTWDNLCTASDNCNSSAYCPSGYSIPTGSICNSLTWAQGRGSQLYSALGLSSDRVFWSSTEQSGSTAYEFYVTSSNAGVSGDTYKTYTRYVLCYKPS